MKHQVISLGGLCSILMVVASLTGCAQPATSSSQEPKALNLEISSEKAAEVAIMLARADAVDGVEDNHVRQCPGCALAMEGSDEYALDVADYALHFCSDECKSNFAEQAETSILALALPDPAEE